MGYEFINTIAESKIYRSNLFLEKHSEEHVREMLYMYVLGLHMLVNSPDERDVAWARDYCSRTGTMNNFDNFRLGGNDLYVFAFLIIGKNRPSTFKAKGKFNKIEFLTYLRRNARDQQIDHLLPTYFRKLEGGLKITEPQLKATRRLVSYWDDIEDFQQLRAISLLVRNIRSIDRKSEILPKLEDLKHSIERNRKGKQK